jgi:hypothetical protein
MAIKIKNWSEFQHFKDRTPPWIKLYRHLLDDPDWHELSGTDAKTLIMLWLVASEDKNMEGNIPSVKNTAFRLRISEDKLKQALTNLSNWLIQDDDSVISLGCQDDAPETETETEREDKKPSTKIKTSLPKDFEISDEVKKWAKENKHNNLPKHLEAFKLKCESNGYKYINWDSAFKNAVIGNWAKIEIKQDKKIEYI